MTKDERRCQQRIKVNWEEYILDTEAIIQSPSQARRYQDQDNALKHIFSYPKAIKDLLKGFMPYEWIQDLDFDSLERLNVSHTSANLKKRESDIIWRIQFKENPLYIILLLEFQSSVNAFMSVRMLTYSGLAYEDIIKAEKLNTCSTLPPILPIVLYNGNGPWHAPLKLADFYHKMVPSSLLPLQPNIQYILIDINRIKLDETNDVDNNMVVHLVKIEQSSNPTDLEKTLYAAIKAFKGTPEARAILKYFISASRVKNRFIENDFSHISEGSMLSEKFDQWEQEFIQQGMQQGVQQGMQQGALHTQKSILEKILRIRNVKLSPEQQLKIESLNSKELDLILEKLLSEKPVSIVLNEL